MKASGTLGEGLHSGLVTEDAALADRAGGVHRQHGHLFAQIAQVVAQRLNEGALPRARYAGNAYPDGIPRVGEEGAGESPGPERSAWERWIQ